ncbi:hypothetical protein [Leptolyngbya sp. FACHB-261]|uniref:hypothetical protein n=1 Tax=Leptolyngbya sp. FACHB-261 TaxID=2692806 RepID=UPI0016881F98|nr:hypothetical protein [Leptolyngbya sp. FACHB-261]MBD2103806.1 hypothetical protein [Leptolyngbya sp. FACHB-261]
MNSTRRLDTQVRVLRLKHRTLTHHLDQLLLHPPETPEMLLTWEAQRLQTQVALYQAEAQLSLLNAYLSTN